MAAPPQNRAGQAHKLQGLQAAACWLPWGGRALGCWLAGRFRQNRIRPGSAGVVCYTCGGRPSINSFGASGRLRREAAGAAGLRWGSHTLPCTAARCLAQLRTALHSCLGCLTRPGRPRGRARPAPAAWQTQRQSRRRTAEGVEEAVSSCRAQAQRPQTRVGNGHRPRATRTAPDHSTCAHPASHSTALSLNSLPLSRPASSTHLVLVLGVLQRVGLELLVPAAKGRGGRAG